MWLALISFMMLSVRGTDLGCFHSLWLWKPYIIYQMLGAIQDGDYLVYADAGSHLESPIHPLLGCLPLCQNTPVPPACNQGQPLAATASPAAAAVLVCVRNADALVSPLKFRALYTRQVAESDGGPRRCGPGPELTCNLACAARLLGAGGWTHTTRTCEVC